MRKMGTQTDAQETRHRFHIGLRNAVRFAALASRCETDLKNQNGARGAAKSAIALSNPDDATGDDWDGGCGHSAPRRATAAIAIAAISSHQELAPLEKSHRGAQHRCGAPKCRKKRAVSYGELFGTGTKATDPCDFECSPDPALNTATACPSLRKSRAKNKYDAPESNGACEPAFTASSGRRAGSEIAKGYVTLGPVQIHGFPQIKQQLSAI
ncbi:MAG: hypothetical protein AAFY82_04510 [Pseudomonadota bacterium]